MELKVFSLLILKMLIQLVKIAQSTSLPRTDLISLINTELSLPLIKEYNDYTSLLTPKVL